jgi:hypothetical protein
MVHKTDQVIQEYGWSYHGEVRDGKRHGRGTYIGRGRWNSGNHYEGEFVDGGRHGRGLLWLGESLCFEGSWAHGLAKEGTAVEADGTYYKAVFKSSVSFYDASDWRQAMASATRTQCGRIESWPRAPGAPGGIGGAAEWTAAAVRPDGSRFEGFLRGLCPLSGTETDAAGACVDVAYAGHLTLAEEPQRVPREQVLQLGPPRGRRPQLRTRRSAQ